MLKKDTYFRVLDDGFIGIKDWMGGDEDIEQAARVSYGKGTRKRTETRGLLRYLMRHRHTTPFEMVEFKFHVRVPMDCWRQWIRHRTASVNEYSTRYSEAIDARQCTNSDDWRLQSSSNKQGSGGFVEEWPENFTQKDNIVYDENGEVFCQGVWTPGELLTSREEDLHICAQDVYNERLKMGVSREQARKDLPLSTYTEAYWKVNLKNLLHFLSLRCDSHAQLEIRKYANVMAGMVKEICPLTFEAWYDYHFQAEPLTRLDRQVLVYDFAYQVNEQQTSGWDQPTVAEYAEEIGMSKREFAEYEKKTQLPKEQDFTLDWETVIEQ